MSLAATTSTEADDCGARDPLWNRRGEVLYADVGDGIFGVPGRWSVRQTCGHENRLLWLDPRPTAEILPTFYRNYFTHGADPAGRHNAALDWIYRRLVAPLPYMRERERLEELYLDNGRGRSILEIGCGSGARLDKLRRRGWKVSGQDVDPAAALNAHRQFGLEIHVGEVTDLDLPDASFDAIAMNHVIEHLLDPAAVLRRCRRLLAPGGILLVLTPNIDSYAHAVFGTAWFGLDPPRHLQLFSMDALRTAIAEAGFSRLESWTTSARAQTVARGSVDLRAGLSPWAEKKTLAREAEALLFQWRASWRHKRSPEAGEELVVRAHVE